MENFVPSCVASSLQTFLFILIVKQRVSYGYCTESLIILFAHATALMQQYTFLIYPIADMVFVLVVYLPKKYCALLSINYPLINYG